MHSMNNRLLMIALIFTSFTGIAPVYSATHHDGDTTTQSTVGTQATPEMSVIQLSLENFRQADLITKLERRLAKQEQQRFELQNQTEIQVQEILVLKKKARAAQLASTVKHREELETLQKEMSDAQQAHNIDLKTMRSIHWGAMMGMRNSVEEWHKKTLGAFGAVRIHQHSQVTWSRLWNVIQGEFHVGNLRRALGGGQEGAGT